MRRRLVTALAACVVPALGVTFVAQALQGCGQGPLVVDAGSSGPDLDAARADPIDFGPLTDFRLTSQHGKTVTLADLRGRPFVVGALFTTCTGPCPSIARALLRLQDQLADTDVRIVVVSVDPEADSPEVLARWADRVGADPLRWTLLTGPEEEVHRLVREGFWMPVDRAAPGAPPGEAVTHDVRLLAVDREGHRRGWYTGTEENQVEKLRRRLVFLASGEARGAAGVPDDDTLDDHTPAR